MTGIKWKRMLAALCCAFIAISGGCANPSTSSGSSVSQESGIPASQETSETQAPSQMAESAYEPSAPLKVRASRRRAAGPLSPGAV